MRFWGLILFLIFATACGAQNTEKQSGAANQPLEIPAPPVKQTVLVELFTSEG